MSDETKVASGQGKQQPAGQAPAVESVKPPVTQEQPPTGQEEAPKYVTREEALGMVEEGVRRAQSYSDAGRRKIAQAVEEVTGAVAVMRANGREISDADAEAMRTQAISKAMISTEAETPADPAAAPVELQYSPQDFYAEGYRLEGKHGITIEKGNPEQATIKITGNRDADLKSLQDAFAAKALRLNPASLDDNDQEEVPVGSAARVPVRGAPVVTKLTRDEKLSKGLSGNWSQGKPPGAQ